MMLVPYTRRFRDNAMFNPFHSFEELERSFFEPDMSQFRTDIRDNGDSFLLEADLPGFKKEDIQVDVEDDRLTITAQRHSDYEQKDKKGNYLRCERTYGAYSRAFDTTGINTEAITAAYHDGVLSLTLPKLAKQESTARRLLIE